MGESEEFKSKYGERIYNRCILARCRRNGCEDKVYGEGPAAARFLDPYTCDITNGSFITRSMQAGVLKKLKKFMRQVPTMSQATRPLIGTKFVSSKLHVEMALCRVGSATLEK